MFTRTYWFLRRVYLNWLVDRARLQTKRLTGGQDKYKEFMVTIRKDHGKENLQIEYHESYWEQHASLVRERIPRFLEGFAEKILKTGKYLNVVAECGKGG